MTREEFISSIKIVVEEDSVKSVESILKDPPGRKPSIRLIEMSGWFNKLSKKDQEMVMQIVKESANTSVFSFLCVLDGVSTIEDGREKGELKLYYEKGKTSVWLNNPEEEYLHDLFSSEE